MFKAETIKKVINLMNDEYKRLDKLPIEDIKMCISDGNKKIGRVLNVSLPPILTCANCSECKYLCYDVKACNQYPNTVINARVRNLIILKKAPERYWNTIIEKCRKRRKNKFFRYHVAGDILNIEYLSNMVRIARMFPDFKFWTYTKNYKLVNKWIANNGNLPENLTIMYSEWRGMEMVNPYGQPEFRVVFKDEKKPIGFYCPGNCDVCKANNCGCVKGETVYCNEH